MRAGTECQGLNLREPERVGEEKWAPKEQKEGSEDESDQVGYT